MVLLIRHDSHGFSQRWPSTAVVTFPWFPWIHFPVSFPKFRLYRRTNWCVKSAGKATIGEILLFYNLARKKRQTVPRCGIGISEKIGPRTRFWGIFGLLVSPRKNNLRKSAMKRWWFQVCSFFPRHQIPWPHMGLKIGTHCMLEAIMLRFFHHMLQKKYLRQVSKTYQTSWFIWILHVSSLKWPSPPDI